MRNKDEEYFGGCAWHSFYVKDCLACNPTPTCVYYPHKEDSSVEVDDKVISNPRSTYEHK